jgi:hypothetical protein
MKLIAAALVSLALSACMQLDMPGASFEGTAPPATAEESALATRLQKHVEVLSADIGRRHLGEHARLLQAQEYLETTLRQIGYAVEKQEWQADGKAVANLAVSVPGISRPSEIVLLGAHYDSARQSPGADDNGSGVAALVEIARAMRAATPAQTVRFVLFVNEEPPFFGTPAMGSWHDAQAAGRRGDKLRAALILDSIGRFSSEPGSQHYPALVASKFPDRGNFIGFVSRNQDVALVRQSIGAFRKATPVPSIGAAMPAMMEGVWYSDHWSFWQFGYPAIMVTDTAFFRYRDYHRAGDTMDHLDFLTLARVTRGLEDVMKELADGTPARE